MLDWLYELLGSIIAWFSNTLGGGYYVIGIFFYALLFKIVFIPFTIKQQQNQIAMAKLTPKIELIKAKYKGRNDQVTMQKMNQEILELQQAEGYNPLSGCLPLIIQMPIIIFLYNVIRNPLSYICKLNDDAVKYINTLLTGETVDKIKNINQIGLIGKINEYGVGSEAFAEYSTHLEKLPDFTLFGKLDLAATPSFTSWLVLIPFIAAGLTWLTMFLTRKWNGNPMAQGQDAQAQASMKIMDYTMPLMTLWIAFSFSGMLGIYWIYQSALGILQTYILAKVMPLPKYTEEELREMKKAQKAAEKAQKAALKQQPKYRSLHYIDDEDYEELPELNAKSTDSTDKKAPGGIDVPDIKD